MEDLFSQYDLASVLRNQEEELKQAVEKLRRNEVLAVSESDLVNHLASRFSIEVPGLHREGMYAEEEETKIDVSGYPDVDMVRPTHLASLGRPDGCRRILL